MEVKMYNKKQVLVSLGLIIFLVLLSIPLYAEVNPVRDKTPKASDGCPRQPISNGIKIAVLDSGCPAGLYYKAKSFTSLNVNEDLLGHGTKICRIIKDNAPSAKIYFAQVCDNSSRPDAQAIIKAIKWCEEEGVDVANLSLTINYNQAVEEAIKEAYLTKGIIFVVAAGNKSFTNQFAARDGFIYLKAKDDGRLFPASSDFVISVGALDRKGRLAEYSEPKADVSARGYGYGLEGTSIASAYTSAEVCQLLPQLSNKDLAALKASLQR